MGKCPAFGGSENILDTRCNTLCMPTQLVVWLASYVMLTKISIYLLSSRCGSIEGNALTIFISSTSGQRKIPSNENFQASKLTEITKTILIDRVGSQIQCTI